VATRDALHDVLRTVGDLTADEVQQRVLAGVDAAGMLSELERERRAVRVRLSRQNRWIDAADAGLYRDALGVVPPAGLPAAFLADVVDPLMQLALRYARTHGPFTTSDLRGRYGVDMRPVLSALERAGEVVRGELRPGGTEREWCHPEVLRRLRRASLAVLRKEIEPVDQPALARFMPAWQNVDRHPTTGAGVDRLREALVPLQALALPANVWEREILPRRVGAYSPAWMDQLCASGEIVWIGAGALGRNSGRVAFYFREDAGTLGPPPNKATPPDSHSHDRLRQRLGAGACFFTDLLADVGVAPEELQEALWDLVWAGEVTNDAFAPLRAPRLTLARARRAQLEAGRAGRFTAARRRGRGAVAQLQGRWSLTGSLFRAAVDPVARRRAIAELLLERYGILTREQVLAEGLPGGFAAIYAELSQLETLGVARRGYFVEGLGGAQFALPGAVERLRAGSDSSQPPLVLSAVDPAQPYGGTLPWPARDDARRPARVAGAYVVLLEGEPILYLERSGRALQTLVGDADDRLQPALAALVEHVHRGAIKRLALERVDGEAALSSPLGTTLVALGFQEGPRRLTLSA
jgi:ATP-dependent Lhr-like helicase